jgi:hypothetical protein
MKKCMTDGEGTHMLFWCYYYLHELCGCKSRGMEDNLFFFVCLPLQEDWPAIPTTEYL